MPSPLHYPARGLGERVTPHPGTGPRIEVQAYPKRVGEEQMAPSSKNGAHSSKTKDGSSPPVWRMPFDAVEKPVSSSSESLVQSKTFMDGVAIAWRLQRRVGV